MKDYTELLKALQQARTKKSDEKVIDVLISMFQRNLPVHDFYYIERRLREVMEGVIDKLDFANKEIEEMRTAHLKAMLEQAVKEVPKPKEWLKKDLDKTEARDAACEPVVHELLKVILDEKLLFSDPEYTEMAIQEQEGNMFRLLGLGYVDSIFSRLELSLQTSMNKANEILWGGKTKEEVTLKQVDATLKTNPINANPETQTQ